MAQVTGHVRALSALSSASVSLLTLHDILDAVFYQRGEIKEKKGDQKQNSNPEEEKELKLSDNEGHFWDDCYRHEIEKPAHTGRKWRSLVGGT